MKAFIRMRTHVPNEGLARDTGWATVVYKKDVVSSTERFFIEEAGWRKVATCMAGESKEKAC